uniref:ABC transmembrane type-1 domain-containing protein n=1 Tax=Candidatus Methanophaga sp. ANME-1 ERB7 TaxID=2759913 RepID=A0A7G9ZAW2_9EURY|nr:hypothetical protein MLPLCDNK_00018 [Methanosarcinales archaeon ANME-1 ERB7]
MSQENRTVRWFYHSIPFIILFLLWEIVARVIHNPYILPPFSAVVASAFSPSLAYHLGITLTLSLLALLIISLVGLPLGMFMYRFKEAEWVLSPLFWFLLFALGLGLGSTGIAPILIMLFGLSQLTVLLFSILIPSMVVALISCYGAKLTAVRVGFLLCWSLQISAGYQISMAGLGGQLSIFYHLHNLEMVYAIMLIMGFTGLFVDSVLKYMGNKTKER